MKEITKTSRLAGQLEKLYRLLNESFFDSVLEMPVITIQSTPRAYGHYTLFDAWNVKGEGRKEINVGAGTLDRSIEEVAATLLHEMCHQYNDTILHRQDCSRGGTYHNQLFKQTAEAHGLLVTRSEKYGWNHTEPSDALLDWILHLNLQEIQLNRNEHSGVRIAGGSHTGDSFPVGITPKRSNSRRYQCPCCKSIARTTRAANLICGDCMQKMILT